MNVQDYLTIANFLIFPSLSTILQKHQIIKQKLLLSIIILMKKIYFFSLKKEDFSQKQDFIKYSPNQIFSLPKENYIKNI